MRRAPSPEQPPAITEARPARTVAPQALRDTGTPDPPEPPQPPQPPRPAGDVPGHSCVAGEPTRLGSTGLTHRSGDSDRIDARVAAGGDSALAAWAVDEQTLSIQPLTPDGKPVGSTQRVDIAGAHRMRLLRPLGDRFVLITQHWCAGSRTRLCAYGIALDREGRPVGQVDVDPLLGRPAEIVASTRDALCVFRSHVHLRSRMLRYTVGAGGALGREQIDGFGWELYEGGPLGLFADGDAVRLLIHEQPPDGPRGRALLRTRPGSDRHLVAVPTRWDAAIFEARLEGDELALIRGERDDRPLLFRYDETGRPAGRPLRLKKGEVPPAPFDTNVNAEIAVGRKGAGLVRRTAAGDLLSTVPLLRDEPSKVRHGTVAVTPDGYLALLGVEAGETRDIVALPVRCGRRIGRLAGR